MAKYQCRTTLYSEDCNASQLQKSTKVKQSKNKNMSSKSLNFGDLAC